MKNNWLNKTEYPFAPHYFHVNGQQVHYIDEGKGDVLLFVHGTPSWSFDFRHIIQKLKTQYRCIAIDHIGFGLSSKPEQYDYSTINHSHTLEKFIAELNLTNINLVVHDFGGPIGLHFAETHPEKIKKIIVFNSWLWSSKSDPAYLKLRKILKSPLLPFLYKQLNFSPRFILPASFGNKKLKKGLRSQYTKPFSKPSERNGTLAFAKSLLNDQDWFEELWKNKTALSQKPILFIWGMLDKIITPQYLEKFTASFTNNTICKIETAGHFPQEEEPEITCKAIAEFLK